MEQSTDITTYEWADCAPSLQLLPCNRVKQRAWSKSISVSYAMLHDIAITNQEGADSWSTVVDALLHASMIRSR